MSCFQHIAGYDFKVVTEDFLNFNLHIKREELYVIKKSVTNQIKST